jgi:hypothetical protein
VSLGAAGIDLSMGALSSVVVYGLSYAGTPTKVILSAKVLITGLREMKIITRSRHASGIVSLRRKQLIDIFFECERCAFGSRGAKGGTWCRLLAFGQ